MKKLKLLFWIVLISNVTAHYLMPEDHKLYNTLPIIIMIMLLMAFFYFLKLSLSTKDEIEIEIKDKNNKPYS